MKLIIQIPCFNEEQTLPQTLRDLPCTLDGVDTIEILVIDDGSSDRTRQVARELGVDHVVGFAGNRGLARAFQLGLDACLVRGADVIVNTDADNQYSGAHIAQLVAPIVQGQADIVIGDRQTRTLSQFSPLKRFLQSRGSAVTARLAGMPIPDATSGFRALSRQAALELNVTSDFSYTLETLIHAGTHRLQTVSVPIATNPQTRKSRLFDSVATFVRRSAATIVRVYTGRRPLKVFLAAALVSGGAGAYPFIRFLYFCTSGQGGGHIQSLLFGLVLILLGCLLAAVGVLADLISTNRILMERVLCILRDRRETEHGRKDVP